MNLSRRSLIVGSFGAALLRAQTYRDYSRCLPDYLRTLAQAAYERRNAEIAKLTTPAAIAARTHWIRTTFWDLAGGQPERTPLNARIVASFFRPGYRMEKVVYESQPGFVIPANLYLPMGLNRPAPAILFQMGHSLNGKAHPEYQKCCQGLARLGFVVLAFDPMGQGERSYYPGPGGITRLGSADDEHTYPGKQMLLTGDTATRLQVWDAVRSLDYLASRPEVDPARLGSTGQSGGGTLTMLLASVDDRLAAAAVISGNTENFACKNFNPPGSTDDAEQNLIGSGAVGFDRWDLLYPLAPKPLLVLVSAQDSFGTYSPNYLTSGREEFQKLRRIYSMLGAAEKLEWAETPLPHGLSYYPRMRVYQWITRWLLGSRHTPTQEPEVAPEPDPRIWVGASGSVMQDFGSVTPFQLNQRRSIPRKGPFAVSLAVPPRLRVLSSVPSGSLTIQAVEVQSEDQIWLPAWLFLPSQPDPTRAVTLLLDERGRNRHWREGGTAERWALAGRTVCVADLRGIGDLKPETGRGAPGYAVPHAQEEDYAWASLILGEPLLIQRVRDILALAAALKKVTIAANGRLTVPAMYAASITTNIESLQLQGGLASFSQVVNTGNYRCPLANIIPRLLEHGDLPDLAKAIAPRRIQLAEMQSPAAELKKLYPYSNVAIMEQAPW